MDINDFDLIIGMAKDSDGNLTAHRTVTDELKKGEENK